MRTGIYRISLISLLAVALATPSSADIKIKTKRSMMGHVQEDTVYIKGARERRETAGMAGMGGMTTILQCDQRRYIMLNDSTKTYMITSMDAEEEAMPAGKSTNPSSKSNGANPPAEKSSKPSQPRQGGVLTITNNSTDTGERQDMFGYKARHVKSSMSMESSPDACSKANTRIENDGWYADLSPGLTCQTRLHPRTNIGAAMGSSMEKPECQDRMRFRTTGYTNTGYALKLTTTMSTGGANSFTTITEVVELSKATLDPALFDIPPGYTEAKSYRDMMPSVSQIAQQMQTSRQTAGTASQPQIQETTGPKQAGVLRVGVVKIADKSGQKVPQMRGNLMEDLKNAMLDPVRLEGSNPVEIEGDAKAKQCDYILYTDIGRAQGASAGKKVGGFFGGLVGAGPTKPSAFDVTLAFRLFKPDEEKPQLDSTAESREATKITDGVGVALEGEVRAILQYIRSNQ